MGQESDPELPALLGGSPVFPDGPPTWPLRDPAITSVFHALLESGDWGRYHGPHTTALSRQLADFHAVEHCLLCCSGTAAVELALRGAGVQDHDEVILAAYDFKANFQNVLALKAVPVLVDVERTTCQLDPARIEAAVTPRTRAILVSHLHGGVVDVPRIRELARGRGLAVIEDACQATGARLFGRRAGAGADVGVISFGGSKLLTAGRGGAVLTSRPEIAERIKRHVQRGNDAYPLSEMAAALLPPQVAQLDSRNRQRFAAVRTLRQMPAVARLNPFPEPPGDVEPSYYKFGFQYSPAAFGGLTRDQFVAAAHAEGVALDAGFRSNHLIHASRRFRAADELVAASHWDQTILTLHHPILLEAPQALEGFGRAIDKIFRHAEAIIRHGE